MELLGFNVEQLSKLKRYLDKNCTSLDELVADLDGSEYEAKKLRAKVSILEAKIYEVSRILKED